MVVPEAPASRYDTVPKVGAVRVTGGSVGTNQTPTWEAVDLNHLTTGYSILYQAVLVGNEPSTRNVRDWARSSVCKKYNRMQMQLNVLLLWLHASIYSTHEFKRNILLCIPPIMHVRVQCSKLLTICWSTFWSCLWPQSTALAHSSLVAF